MSDTEFRGSSLHSQLENYRGNELLDAIRTVSKGDYYFSQKIAKLAEKYLP